MVLAHMREPKRAPLLGAGQRKFEDHVEAAAECGIEACPTVAGQERDAIEGLDALEQIVGLRVGKTVVGFLDFGALAEQRIGFVEEENDTGLLGLRQELCEVLLGLPYIFAGDGGEIRAQLDRKSTRLNSSHQIISYAVFCLKKKKKVTTQQ